MARVAMNLPGVATAMRLTKRFAPVFGVRAADVAVRFGFNLALARALGADGSGSYYLALSVVTIAASVALPPAGATSSSRR